MKVKLSFKKTEEPVIDKILRRIAWICGTLVALLICIAIVLFGKDIILSF